MEILNVLIEEIEINQIFMQIYRWLKTCNHITIAKCSLTHDLHQVFSENVTYTCPVRKKSRPDWDGVE